MATNAKQYTDLTPAEQVAKDDLLAVAQSGATELKSATVEQMAAPVAEVLSTGALTELEYATSQGKNAIAAALNNKGVATTASETLIQMADKVNGLSVDTKAERITGTAIAAASYTSIANTACYVFESSQKLLTVRGDTVYLTPAGSYTNKNDIIQNAAATATITAISSSDGVCIVASKDDSKILIRTALSSSVWTVTVLNVDHNANTLNVLYNDISLTTSMSSSYAELSPYLAISNNGENIFFFGGSTNTLSVYHIPTQTTSTISDVQYSRYGGILIASDTELYACVTSARVGGATGFTAYYKYTYTMDETGSFTSTQISQKIVSDTEEQLNAYQATLRKLDNSTVVGFWYKDSDRISLSETGPYGYIQHVYNLDTGADIVLPYLYSVYSSSTNISYSYSNVSQPYAMICQYTYPTYVSSGVYKLTGKAFNNTLYIDFNTNTAYLEQPTDNICTVVYDSTYIHNNSSCYVYGLVAIPLVGYDKNNCMGGLVPGGSAAPYDVAITYRPEQLIAIKWNTNNLTGYLIPKLTSDLVAAGYYDINTTITPAVPDSES